MYDIGSHHWTLITDDTASMGGPDLIFDHQMCMDQENRVLYVFGGQSLGLVLRGNLNCNCLIDFLLGTNDSSFHEKITKKGKTLPHYSQCFSFPI